MKQGWEIKKLGNVCTILNGGTPSTKVPEYWGGEHLWITPKDMGKLNSIYVDETERKITDEGLRNSSAKLIPINSIIVSTRAPIGHLAINRKLISTNQGCKGVVPSDEINTLYLFNFLKNSVKLLNNLGRGTTFKELSSSKLSSVEIPIPTLPEQERIIAKLDQCFEDVDKAKDNVECNLQNAQELFQSQLTQIFSQKGDDWVEKKLGEVCTLQRGFDLPTRLRTKGKYPLVSSSGISDSHNEFKVKAPGVATGRSGSIGNVFYIEDDFWPLNTVLYIKDFHNNYERFVYYLLILFDLEKYASGAGVPTLNRNFVHGEKVNVPALISEQERIVNQLDELSEEIKNIEFHYQRELDALDELKKSILQKAFNGELTTIQKEAAA